MNAPMPLSSDAGPANAGRLLTSAEALVPRLRALAASTAENRRVDHGIVSDLKESGLLRLLQPRRFGGFSGDYQAFTRIIRTLARGCGSTAWVYGVLGEHNWIISMFPEQAQHEVWDNDPKAVASSSLGPSGTGEEIDGGLRIQGRWPFSSGCDHAQWVLLGANVRMRTGKTEHRICLVPKDAVQIVDDWFVLGLRGTGSKTLQASDLFVPKHRSVADRDLKAACTDGATAHPDFALCRAQRGLFASFSLGSVAVGLAQRAVETFTETTRTRNSRGTMVAQLESIQLRLSEASVEAEVATLLAEETCRKNIAGVEAGKTFTQQDLAWTRRNSVYCVKLSYNAIQRLFEASGGGALHDSVEIQTIFRDATAASHHLFLGWENNAKPYGQILLGGDADHPHL